MRKLTSTRYFLLLLLILWAAAFFVIALTQIILNYKFIF